MKPKFKNRKGKKMTKKRKPKFKGQTIRNEGQVVTQTNGQHFENLTINTPASKVDETEAHSEPLTMKARPSFKRAIARAADEHGMARSEFIRMAAEMAVKYSDQAIEMGMDVNELVDQSVRMYLKLRSHKASLQKVMIQEMAAAMTDDLIRE